MTSSQNAKFKISLTAKRLFQAIRNGLPATKRHIYALRRETQELKSAVELLGKANAPEKANVPKIEPIEHIDQLEGFLKAAHAVECGLPIVRIGGPGDGGYLIPDDLCGIEACFSPGVSNVYDFELDLAERNIKSFMADASVKSIPEINPLLAFESTFIGVVDEPNFKSLDTWVGMNAPEAHNLILQMDIEGSEFDAICGASRSTLKKFRIMAIEFHDMEKLLTPDGFRLINLTFKKILNDFSVVHIHPNNCCGSVKNGIYEIPRVMEFTFLRNDRFVNDSKLLKRITAYPHPLDAPNVPAYADFSLPPCWYPRA